MRGTPRRAAHRSVAGGAGPRSSVLLDVGAEPVEAALPDAAIGLDPDRGVLQLCRAEPAFAGAADLLRDHEVDLLEDPDVLLEAVERQAERLGQFADCRRPAGEPLEDAPARRVGEGEERAIECLAIVHRAVQYKAGEDGRHVSGEPAQRKLILYMSMSLDGFAAGRDGTMEWFGVSPRHGSHRQRA